MEVRDVEGLLKAVRAGTVSVGEALNRLRRLPYETTGDATVDWHRALRQGAPEVVLAEHKTPEETARIFRMLTEHSRGVIATRASRAHYDAVVQDTPTAEYHEKAKMITWRGNAAADSASPKDYSAARDSSVGQVAILTAGTSDRAVAEEAIITLSMLDIDTVAIHDVGVAGLHRLLGRWEEWEQARVLIVIAGMDGALPSVVGGLTNRPVIAVPTSVGYGTHWQGLAPLLTMLNSCAPGVLVANIDNGFGAAFAAARIMKGMA